MNGKRRCGVAPGASGRWVNAKSLPATISITTSALAATGVLNDRATQYALVIGQTASVAWLAQLGWSRARRWATAAVVVAVAWIPTFLASSWIYAIDSSVLDVGSATQALALVELSLLGLIAGFTLWPRKPHSAGSPYVEVVPGRPDRRWVVAWLVVGLAGLAVVLQAGGGPIHYLRNINHEGSLTQGQVYFIVLALALLFVAQTVVYLRWSRGLSIDRFAAVGFLAALVLVGILGARLLLTVALVQTFLFRGCARPRSPLRVMAPLVVVAAVVLTLGVGAAKRYSGYQSQHPGTNISLARYLWTVAPGEIPVAFADNYADGVRLLALSRITVPRYADYEYGKEVLRFLLQPLPRGVRPVIQPEPGLKATFYPGGGYVYAQPLQVVSYLQFGVAGIAVAFILLGALIAELDFRLATLPRVRPSTLALITGVIVEILATLRNASGPSCAFALASLAVLYAVARSSECLLPAR